MPGGTKIVDAAAKWSKLINGMDRIASGAKDPKKAAYQMDIIANELPTRMNNDLFKWFDPEDLHSLDDLPNILRDHINFSDYYREYPGARKQALQSLQTQTGPGPLGRYHKSRTAGLYTNNGGGEFMWPQKHIFISPDGLNAIGHEPIHAIRHGNELGAYNDKYARMNDIVGGSTAARRQAIDQVLARDKDGLLADDNSYYLDPNAHVTSHLDPNELVADMAMFDLFDPERSSEIFDKDMLGRIRNFISPHLKYSKYGAAGLAAAGLNAGLPKKSDAAKFKIDGKSFASLLESILQKRPEIGKLARQNATYAAGQYSEAEELAKRLGSNKVASMAEQWFKGTNESDEIRKGLIQLGDDFFGSGLVNERYSPANVATELKKAGFTESEGKALYRQFQATNPGVTERMTTKEDKVAFDQWAGMTQAKPVVESMVKAEPKPLKALEPLNELPIPIGSDKGKSAQTVLSDYIRGGGEHANRVKSWAAHGSEILPLMQRDLKEIITERPDEPLRAILLATQRAAKTGIGVNNINAQKAIIRLTNPMELERLMPAKKFKELMDWAGVSTPRLYMRGVIPLVTAGAITFMTPDGEVQAMPVDKAIEYTAKAAKHLLGKNSMQHDDAYKIVGDAIHLKMPWSKERETFTINDMITNNKDSWHMIVESPDAKQYAVPLTKEEFHTFMQAKGIAEYGEKFALEGPQGKKAMAHKSLNIRQEKRWAMDQGLETPQLMSEVAAQEQRSVDLLKKIDPDLVRDMVMFHSDKVSGPSVPIPRYYADLMVAAGEGRITKILAKELPPK